MPVIAIEDPEDPRIAAFRDVRERDLVGRDGKFIAEGEVVLRTLIAARRHRPVSVLVASKRLTKLSPLLAPMADNVPIYAAPDDVVDGIAGFHLHRGILALGEAAVSESASDILARLPTRALVMVLIGIANHDNMGGLFRNAAAFGVDAVLLDSTCCDPMYRKALRVSVGAVLTVPFARMASGDEMVDELERHRFSPFALTPSGPQTLSEICPPQRPALLFGAEGPGLPPHILTRAQGVRIDMASGFDSLNVATASGIALHHFARI